MSKKKGNTNRKLEILNEINHIDKKLKRTRSKIKNCSHYKKFADNTWSILDIPEFAVGDQNAEPAVKEYHSLIEIEKTLTSKRNTLRSKLKTKR